MTVNGESRSLAEGATVDWLVDNLGSGQRGVAVAVNSEVVSRSAWDSTVLTQGDHVEVLRAVPGG